MFRVLFVLSALLVSACSTPGTLNYVATGTALPGPRVVSGVTVDDKRDEKPSRVATIRGGYGNPVKVLDTTQPVAVLAQDAFTKALAQRGMLNSAGPYRFAVTLHTLYGDQYMGRKAELLMDLLVIDASGRTIYTDRAKDQSYDFTFFDNGVFASIETLRSAVETLLSKDIDMLLDKPALRQAIGRGPGASPVS